MIVNKSIVIGVILLFIGLALAPSINANIAKESELVEITTEICGLDGGKHTVQLTKEEAEEVEQLFDDIERRLDGVETREEAVEIFNEAVVELDKYGLLGGLSFEQAQRLIIERFQKTNSQIINKNKIHNLINRGIILNDDSDFINTCCLLSATATEDPDYWPPPPMIFPLGIGIIIAAIFIEFFLKLGRLGEIISFFIGAAVLGFPFKFMNLIVFMGYDVDCHSFGLKGYENSHATGFFGYTGLTLNILSEKAYFLGFSFFVG